MANRSEAGSGQGFGEVAGSWELGAGSFKSERMVLGVILSEAKDLSWYLADPSFAFAALWLLKMTYLTLSELRAPST